MIDGFLGGHYGKLNWNKTNEAARSCRKDSPNILQHGDPLQSGKKVRGKLNKQNIFLYSIPPQIPNLNPIENLVNHVHCGTSEHKDSKLQNRCEIVF